MKKRIVFTMAFTIMIATVLLLSDVFAFHAPLIGGKWWQRPAVKETLQLTPDQTSEINAIWTEYKKRIIDLKGDLEKAYLDLENLMDQPELNKENAYTLAHRIAELQASQAEARIKMAIDIRGELSVEQFERLKTLRREFSKKFREKRPQGDRR
ncbi:MAG: periplasmic heavy metal sensor, partial [Deltaproteobacteria bacterium]|nr:periplasmic heavy metal sensor [Deltaproteobacteria bacterium]MBW2078294.1 periplasmic heavy metal sensor [Deltaproteobacteria bacterium]